MKVWGIALLILVSLLAGPRAFAQKITLKKSLFSGWMFSTDSITYLPVGRKAEGLREVMKDEPGALEQLDHYQSHRDLGNFFMVPGLALTVFPIGRAFYKNDWKDGGTNLVKVGFPCLALGIALKGMSSEALKKAVAMHNKNEELFLSHIDFGFSVDRQSGTHRLQFTYSF